jgi:NADPH:quinone reductase-like Zn-dependent oxidoreductase
MLILGGYLRFAMGPDMDYDPVCFDMDSRKKNREMRVVKIDHEEILCDNRIKVVAELAPSFEALVLQTIDRANRKQSGLTTLCLLHPFSEPDQLGRKGAGHLPSQKNSRVLITGLGGPEVLKLVEEELPQPSPGQVRVRVLATGVAYADILMRHGLYPKTPPFPFTPGYDIVGEVDVLGSGVTGFRLGQRVAALTMIGGYSQFTLVPVNHLVPVPDDLDAAEAVSLVLNYVTAYQMLHRATQLRTGNSILIHSAAGGVGTAALQLGKIAGLRMFGTASKSKHQLVSSLGAMPIDYHSENFVDRIQELAPQGLDAVFDPIGGTHWWDSYRCLHRGGSLVCFGAQAAVQDGKLAAGVGFALLAIMKLLPDGKRAFWYNVKSLRDTNPDWFREDLTRLFDLLSQRQIQPVIAGRFPLREATRAQEMLEKSQFSGKVVLLPQE